MTVDRLWFDPSEILIDGHWRSLRDRLPVEDPSLGRQVGEISTGGATDIDAAIAAACKARAGEWGRMAAADRGRILMRMARVVLERIDDLALIEAQDVGKPLRQARADVTALARYLEFYGGAADKLMGETIPSSPGIPSTPCASRMA